MFVGKMLTVKFHELADRVECSIDERIFTCYSFAEREAGIERRSIAEKDVLLAVGVENMCGPIEDLTCMKIELWEFAHLDFGCKFL